MRERVYAENVRSEAEKIVRGLLVREAIDYGLACSETAFVAVRTEAGKPVEGTIFVANALPAGWSEDFIGMSVLGARAATAPSVLGDSAVRIARFASLNLGVSAAVEYAEESAGGHHSVVLFADTPDFAEREAILFDSSRAEDAGRLPDRATLSLLTVTFPDGTPDPKTIDPELLLLIFVDDLASPRARVSFVDLVRQGGKRPLNLRRSPGQVVRAVLVDPNGAWRDNAPRIEVEVKWSR
jgi:Ca-activated chloride channel family protein